MSQRIPLQRVLLPLATMAVAMFMVTGLVGAEAGPEAAQFDAYAHPDGAKYFALSLRPPVEAPASAAHDVVVLFDTSASQTGDYRLKAMEVLKGLLGDLSPGDRVQLVAVDLNAVPMTTQFVAPGSPEMAAAVDKLQGRVPLGSTDMEKAMLGAVGAFGKAQVNPRSVVYIGDGMSTANLLGTERFSNLVKTLVDGRISVTGYAIGPRLDRQLIGALACHTGGMMVDESSNTAADIATQLAVAAEGTVLWPKTVTWPASFAEIFPKNAPPLRTDRESVVVGVYKDAEPAKVQMTVDTPAGEKKLSWDIQPAAPSGDKYFFLPPLVEQARTDGGMSLPLLGMASLKEAKSLALSGKHNLVQLARQALSSGATGDAKRLAEAALAQDPQDAEARAIKRAASKPAGAPAAAAAAPADLNMVGAAPVAPGEANAGALAADFKRRRDLFKSVIAADVQNAINNARKQMSTDSESAIQALKIQLESVQRAPELDPDVRGQLSDQLQAALREAERRQFEEEQRRQQINERLIAGKERQLINENLARDQEKLRQLLERFNSLMDERRYELAVNAAEEAQLLAPDNPVPIAATHNARLVGYWYNNQRLAVEKRRGFMGAMYQIELSHIPFPDEPPIVYPDAETWGQLTARRKERYQSMDLASSGPAEKKISEQLKAPTTLEFIETPLQDVIDYLKDYHGIEIQVDKRALDDVGIGTDTPITKNLKGISLRSALRLLLRELDLTYVIQDEVLLITTPEEAESRLSTKVYPVADLVLPIRTPSFSGGFGGLGGQQGGIGNMGGSNPGGMGGGMGGGGFGGGGGGMFNLPPELLKGILPAQGAGGFQAFSVKDEIPEGTAAEAEAQQAKAVAQLKALDSEAEIDRLFEAGEVPAAALRQVVREKIEDVRDKIMKADRNKTADPTIHDDLGLVISLIQAALRHGQPQPWMYDGMGIAMQLDGRSLEEIERTVMSAMDFVNGVDEMIYIAVYLERIGLEKRALEIYRQAAQIDPTLAEPNLLGLRLAQKLGDLNALRWSTVGILSQAWPKKHSKVQQAADRVARATIEELRSNKQHKQMAEFKKELNLAMVRDVVVKAKWNGEADIDLLVEEPSGTVCSARNPRTTAGGVLLGDSSSPRLDRSDEGSTEAYVCPQGFSGTYRVCVRRVWGKVIAGKVTVEVTQHLRDKREKTISKTISLTNDEVVVMFDLDKGRRKESLKEHQVANAAMQQLAVRQQVLAQQLNALADPGLVSALAMSRSSSGGGSGTTNSLAALLNGGGAVGYQPVIITLPEGANMQVTGVVSADRRYVRVTCVPLFSRITDVRIFNFVAGEESQGSTPNTGGGGFSGGGSGF